MKLVSKRWMDWLKYRKGILLPAACLLFLLLVFVKPFQEVIVRIPSPQYEAVRLFYIWVLRFGILFLALLAVVLWLWGKRPFWLFPAVVVCLGFLYMAVLPPFSAPDEARHFVSAYRLSSQLMGSKSVADEAFAAAASEEERKAMEKGGSVLVREGDGRKEPYSQVGRDSYELVLSELFTMDHGSGVTVRPEAPVNTTPVAYLPQALGITAARLLHVGYIPLIYLGRLFNLLAFAGLSWLAVKLMPFRKEVLMAVSLLPMSLHLAASLSYDAVLIGLSMVFAAWCFYLAFEKKKVGTADVVVLGLLLVLLEPCKVVYLPLAGICLLIAPSKFGSRRRYWISVISVVSALALAMLLMNSAVLSGWIQDANPTIGWQEGASGYTLSDVIKQPYQTFLVCYETLATQLDYYLNTMLGGYLGNLDPDLFVPYFCLLLLWGVLILSAVRRAGEPVVMKAGHKAWIGFLLFLSVVLVFLSMLLGWTPKGFTYITGIQGRYFLPLLPLFLYLLFGGNVTVKRDWSRGLLFLECFVSVYALIRICGVACIR